MAVIIEQDQQPPGLHEFVDGLQDRELDRVSLCSWCGSGSVHIGGVS
jgi:hypothetical protein